MSDTLINLGVLCRPCMTTRGYLYGLSQDDQVQLWNGLIPSDRAELASRGQFGPTIRWAAMAARLRWNTIITNLTEATEEVRLWIRCQLVDHLRLLLGIVPAIQYQEAAFRRAAFGIGPRLLASGLEDNIGSDDTIIDSD